MERPFLVIWYLVLRLLEQVAYGNSEEVLGKWYSCGGMLWPGCLCWKEMIMGESFTVCFTMQKAVLQHQQGSSFGSVKSTE